MPTSYDPQNIFARILRGEIPNKTVLETEYSLVFHDIAPQAPVHVLVIPKGPYVSFDHFVEQAAPAEIIDFNRAIAQVIADLGLADMGYRIISNAGAYGHQEVPHLHMHVLGGAPLGPMLQRS
jgi:histidine triad (HIT) family protein